VEEWVSGAWTIGCSAMSLALAGVEAVARAAHADRPLQGGGATRALRHRPRRSATWLGARRGVRRGTLLTTTAVSSTGSRPGAPAGAPGSTGAAVDSGGAGAQGAGEARAVFFEEQYEAGPGG